MQVQRERSGSEGVLALDLEMPGASNMLSDVRCALAELPLPARVLHDAQLLTSEMVANSIRHAGLGPKDRIRVRAVVAGGKLRVDVFDGGGAGTPPSAGALRPNPGAGSGWGLFLVESVAARWGHGVGRYWFELEFDPPGRDRF